MAILNQQSGSTPRPNHRGTLCNAENSKKYRFDYYTGAVNGSAQHLGDFTYYNLQPQVVAPLGRANGDKNFMVQHLGNFDYYTGALNGSVQHLGNFNYYTGDLNGSVQHVGDFTYYNLRPRVVAPPTYYPVPNPYQQLAPVDPSYTVSPYANPSSLDDDADDPE